jgi:hypothetical protein
MKTLWIIPIVVLSVFACSETKEKPLTPIYADAFYEPDFIPYLMLKHGVDTIKGFYDKEVTSAYLRKIDTSQPVVIHSFNLQKLIYVEQSVSSIRDVIWFNCDSLIKIEGQGGWDVVTHYQFGYKRIKDTIFKFVEDYQFSIFGKYYDSIVRFDNPREFKIDSNAGARFIFNKKGELIKRYEDGLTTYRYDKKNKLVHSYFELTHEGNISEYLRKDFVWNKDTLIKSVEVHYERYLSKNPYQRITYYRNGLPYKREHYVLDSLRTTERFKIIRNAKK